MTNTPATNTQTNITLCRLSEYGLLSIVSSDNLKFLQGQLTCDVKEVTAEQWRYGALCTNKGRMISNFMLAEAAPNQHLLRMHGSTVEAVLTTLKKFAPFYKGTLSDLSQDYTLLGIAGDECTSLIQTIFSTSLTTSNSAHTTAQGKLIKLDAQRYECWIKKESAEKIWQQLGSLATVVDESQWTLLNIRAGLGEVHAPTIESWTPHMLNLQCIGAINFKKGCYTGQEIVARTEYRGHQKRAMYRFAGSGVAPEPATPVMDGEQQAGEIVMASASAHAQWEGLAVISEPHLAHELRCQQEAIARLELPYTIKPAHKTGS